MIELNGFEEFIQCLNDGADRVDENLPKEVKKLGNKLLRKVKKRTPVGEINGGTLRKSWFIEKVSELEVQVYNTEHYAPHVELGHRTRLGKGGRSTNPNYKYKPKPGGISMVPGRFMLTRSIEDIDRGLDGDIETMIDQVFE